MKIEHESILSIQAGGDRGKYMQELQQLAESAVSKLLRTEQGDAAQLLDIMRQFVKIINESQLAEGAEKVFGSEHVITETAKTLAAFRRAHKGLAEAARTAVFPLQTGKNGIPEFTSANTNILKRRLIEIARMLDQLVTDPGIIQKPNPPIAPNMTFAIEDGNRERDFLNNPKNVDLVVDELTVFLIKLIEDIDLGAAFAVNITREEVRSLVESALELHEAAKDSEALGIQIEDADARLQNLFLELLLALATGVTRLKLAKMSMDWLVKHLPEDEIENLLRTNQTALKALTNAHGKKKDESGLLQKWRELIIPQAPQISSGANTVRIKRLTVLVALMKDLHEAKVHQNNEEGSA